MMKMTKIVATLLLTSTLVSATTLITVNGTQITQQDVDTALMNATQGRFNQVPAEKQAEFRKQVLEQLIAKELVFGDAQKTGVLNSKDFKDEFVQVQERVKKELAIQVWQKQQLDKVEVSDKELKNYYDKNKDEFNEKETVHARHILVKTEEEAKNIVKSLKSLKGEALKAKFIEEAKAKSTGPSGPKGGDLGYFAQGQMVPEFNDKVFGMKVGTVSEPVKTQFGYHVIYLEDKKAKKTLAFTEVKSFIEQRLKMEKFKVVMQDKMLELKNKATIK
ncbi:peptidyl-prolyl cis-trans isomerase (PpiC-type with SurA N-terminal domain) [Sulfurimonas gotlandica GD1]|jgi:peptidyl-prolyl cis-trans isomerase C|uniref:peptidylprolyl isomerase n=1 Tax=Sulfurimonas gotlandica (strain DSM 19862 / JCM 16533 / GD1) TaxID=929558 RepID=B6BIQ7_SULGG|nr:peptidyl-prolyl cis-trans isomerase [Sulfurimonas gotlandica]EDZ63697.1 PpiC-type peptidyl-prolyl cis-trans isomerase [Sulfurimonas gotlandica GD1]EHP30415.1 peptidyl-prolyl cis-trans isomerase (PpiC-type with SurA N-terminal domain) [Sulfurimonas gotlandica GD1]